MRSPAALARALCVLTLVAGLGGLAGCGDSGGVVAEPAEDTAEPPGDTEPDVATDVPSDSPDTDDAGPGPGPVDDVDEADVPLEDTGPEDTTDHTSAPDADAAAADAGPDAQPPPPFDPCAASDTPADPAEPIVECVCDVDDYCCSEAWDALCVATAASACEAACAAPAPAPACAGACDDGDACTADACDAATGTCSHAPLPGCASDHPCTPAATPGSSDPAVTACVCGLDPACCAGAWDAYCVGHAMFSCAVSCTCTGAPPSCSADADCAWCDDGDVCDGTWTCQDGTCAEAAAEACASGDGCLAATCDPETGACAVAPDDAACEDADPCTVDVCGDDGVCDNLALPGCAAHSPCELGATPGSADADVTACVCAEDPWCCWGGWDSSCVTKAIWSCGATCACGSLTPAELACDADWQCSTKCDDGDLCNGTWACVDGTCAMVDPVACEDDPADGCLVDTCLPKAGVCTPAPSAEACDDSDPCTADTCEADGACTHVQIAGEGCAIPPVVTDVKLIYVVQMSHTDVGFTESPAEVAHISSQHIVSALNLADQHASFSWTIETAWQLDAFWRRASQVDRDRLHALLLDGRFALGVGWVNPHSGVMGEEELHRFVYTGHAYAQDLGVPADTVLLDDVPGFTAAMPRVLARSGVKYLVHGANDFIGGKPAVPEAQRPFWWQARDGSRVLTWLAFGSYGEGAFGDWALNSPVNANQTIPARLADLAEAGYPWDAVLVMRGADNWQPNAGAVNAANAWNAAHPEGPTIVLGTPADFFEHMLETYGEDAFPTVTGDGAGLWESVTAVTPASNALVRRARAALADIEALWAAFGDAAGVPYPAEVLADTWNTAAVFDEHSGGGPGWPGLLTLAQVEASNAQYVALATRCRDAVAGLRATILDATAPGLVPDGDEGLVAFDPLGDGFDGVLEVHFDAPQPADLRLADPAGGPDATFRWTAADRSALALHAELPPHGWRRWTLASGGSTPAPPTWSAGSSVTAGPATLVLDEALGTMTSLTDGVTGIDWLADSGPHRGAGLLVASNQRAFFGIWSWADTGLVTLEVEAGDAPLFRQARVLDAGGAEIKRYRLHADGHLDLRITLDRAALPPVEWSSHSHHWSVVFPAALALPTTLTVDGPDGLYQPGPDSMPGTGLGHFGSATGAILTGAGGRWMSVSSADSSVLDLGGMTDSAAPALENHERAMSWKLARHHDLTQVKGGAIVPVITEPGLPEAVTYDFTLRFGSAEEPTPSRRTLLTDVAPPAVAVVTGTGEGDGTGDRLIDVLGPAELVAVKRAESGEGHVLRLRGGEHGGEALVVLAAPVAEAWSADLLEQPEEALELLGGTLVTVPLVADGVVTVVVVP